MNPLLIRNRLRSWLFVLMKMLATLAKIITVQEELFNPNVVKVVCTLDGEALYFSRQPIPYLRNKSEEEWLHFHTYYKHLGLYAYRQSALKKITSLRVSSLEKSESLEQLRWLENGYKIAVGITDKESHAVDTPEDIQKLMNFF